MVCAHSGEGRAGKEIERAYTALLRQIDLTPEAAPRFDVYSIGELLLAAYPDRVAQRRGSSREEYRLRNGSGARLSSRSHLQAEGWLVALELEQSPGHSAGDTALIHMGSALEVEQILQAFPAATRWVHETFWDEEKQRVLARRSRRLGALILQEQPGAVDADAALPLMLEQLRVRGLDLLGWNAKSKGVYARLCFIGRHNLVKDWPDFTPAHMLAQIEHWLGPWLQGITSVQELQRLDLCQPLLSLLSWEQQQQLEELAPQKIKVPSGSHIRVDYADPQQPRLAVKLQELFGLHRTPRVGGGRIPLLIELLSPARRPIQTTTDLANFWDTTYVEVKKELKGRYPKHPWPDDPTTAPAQRGVKRRGG